MTNRWQPWSRERVAELATSEIVSLTEGDLAALSPFWLVARDEDRVLYWDSVEEEFAIGTLEGHLLTGVTNVGEQLEWAMKPFLKGRASS